MSKLAKLADVKTILRSSSTDADAHVNLLLEQASAIAELLAMRSLRREANRVEFPHAPAPEPARGNTHVARFVTLDLAPIESVSEVVQLYDAGSDSEFDDGTKLTENDDYVIHPEKGKLERLYAYWHIRRRWLRIKYTGGYYDPNDAAPSADAIAPPADLQWGMIQQVIRMYQGGDAAGLREIELTSGGGSVSLAEARAHPSLVEACKGLRRHRT